MTISSKRPWWRLTVFVFVMLVIEFMDEFTYSGIEVARPLFRDEFNLTYVQVGLITTIPVLVATFIEPVIGLFADGKNRRLLMVWGGLLFGTGLLIQGFSTSFSIFLLGLTIAAPSTGVFVNLAQASLGDDAPHRRENRMALWTFSGSLAVVVGPAMLSLMLALGAGWRGFFIGAGIILIFVSLWVWRLPPNKALRSASEDEDEEELSLRDSLRASWELLRSAVIWRWLLLLEFSNLMLDVLFSLLALYMVDVVGVSQAEAGFAIVVWTGIGLLGDLALIPLLERVRGLTYLRVSVVLELLLYPTFLLVDSYLAKLFVLAIIGLFNAGWYAILIGKLFDELGEHSGKALIVGNVAGVVGALLPVILGAVAQAYGLETAMWFLLAGPIALLIGLPRRDTSDAA